MAAIYLTDLEEPTENRMLFESHDIEGGHRTQKALEVKLFRRRGLDEVLHFA
jgi:hypothetical protein